MPVSRPYAAAAVTTTAAAADPSHCTEVLPSIDGISTDNTSANAASASASRNPNTVSNATDTSPAMMVRRAAPRS